MNCVHLVVGPTGAGKTDVAMNIADVHHAPIVVADRIQCYLDLPVTSARLDGVPHRHHLADRTVQDGDYPTREAAYALVRKVEALSRTHEHVVVEGGSISLLHRFADCRGRFPFRLTATVLPLKDERVHLDRLRTRAARMIADGMLDEITKAWQHREQRAFVSSVNGPEAVLQWCTRSHIDPESLPGIGYGEIAELTELIALVHHEHSLEQRDVFTRLFGWNHE